MRFSSLAGIHIRAIHRTLIIEARRLVHLGSVLTVLQAVLPAGRAINDMRTQGLALLALSYFVMLPGTL